MNYLKKLNIMPFFGVLLLINSCRNDNLESLETSTDLAKDVKLNATIYRLTDATRKAERVEIQDLETGNVSVKYVCMNPGYSCDVGETKPKEKILTGISSDDIISNIENLPIFQDAYVQELVKKGECKIVREKEYVGVLDANNNPLYIKKIGENTSLRINAGDTKRAIIDTQTGEIDCTQEGDNCIVPIKPEPVKPKEEILQYVEIAAKAFPNLINKMGNAKVTKLKNGYKITTESNEAYYVKY